MKKLVLLLSIGALFAFGAAQTSGGMMSGGMMSGGMMSGGMMTGGQ